MQKEFRWEKLLWAGVIMEGFEKATSVGPGRTGAIQYGEIGRPLHIGWAAEVWRRTED